MTPAAKSHCRSFYPARADATVLRCRRSLDKCIMRLFFTVARRAQYMHGNRAGASGAPRGVNVLGFKPTDSPSPLEGEGKGRGGVGRGTAVISPLSLTLSRKGRGNVSVPRLNRERIRPSQNERLLRHGARL